MSTSLKGSANRTLVLGTKVDRATATLPATTTQNLFTVAGGRVVVTSILGEVTTAIQAQATTVKLTSAPTTGTAVDLCATVDLSGKELGTLIGITGVLAAAAQAANAGAAVLQDAALIIPIGVIRYVTGATSTGAIKWTLTYVPYDDGASVAAV